MVSGENHEGHEEPRRCTKAVSRQDCQIVWKSQRSPCSPKGKPSTAKDTKGSLTAQDCRDFQITERHRDSHRESQRGIGYWECGALPHTPNWLIGRWPWKVWRVSPARADWFGVGLRRSPERAFRFPISDFQLSPARAPSLYLVGRPFSRVHDFGSQSGRFLPPRQRAPLETVTV